MELSKQAKEKEKAIAYAKKCVLAVSFNDARMQTESGAGLDADGKSKSKEIEKQQGEPRNLWNRASLPLVLLPLPCGFKRFASLVKQYVHRYDVQLGDWVVVEGHGVVYYCPRQRSGPLCYTTVRDCHIVTT